jgi:hypothetical protein
LSRGSACFKQRSRQFRLANDAQQCAASERVVERNWNGNRRCVQPSCMIRWLPLCRTAVNPFCSGIRQICQPERTRRLPNRDFNLSQEHLVVKTWGDFGLGCGFEEQRERLDEVRSRLFVRTSSMDAPRLSITRGRVSFESKSGNLISWR